MHKTDVSRKTVRYTKTRGTAAKTQVFSQLKSEAEKETRGSENKILVRNQSQ